VLLVVIAAAGAAAWFFLFSGTSAEAEKPHLGETVALEPIAVNLAGGGFLKIGLTLQLTEDAVELSDPAGSKAPDLIDLPVLAGAGRRRHRCSRRPEGRPRAEDHRGPRG
jgi:hypothetical protein